MKLQDQVCTLEQAKRLNELGIDSVSVLGYHINVFDNSFITIQFTKDADWDCPAWTVAEMGVMLPALCHSFVHRHDHYFICSINFEFNSKITCEKTEAEARAAMLIHLLENNLITAEEVNARLTTQP